MAGLLYRPSRLDTRPVSIRQFSAHEGCPGPSCLCNDVKTLWRGPYGIQLDHVLQGDIHGQENEAEQRMPRHCPFPDSASVQILYNRTGDDADKMCSYLKAHALSQPGR